MEIYWLLLEHPAPSSSSSLSTVVVKTFRLSHFSKQVYACGLSSPCVPINRAWHNKRHLHRLPSVRWYLLSLTGDHVRSAQWLQLGSPMASVGRCPLCLCSCLVSPCTLFSCLSAVPWLQEKVCADSGLFLKAFSGGKCHLSTSAVVQGLFANFLSSSFLNPVAQSLISIKDAGRLLCFLSN